MLRALGIELIVVFIALRAINLYGDPQRWSVQKNFIFTCFSFVNCTKYPPSLLFLLMTLGPAILLLGVMNGNVNEKAGFVGRPLIIFGRVPLFYYLLHLPLIHLVAVLVSGPHYRLALGSFYYTRPPADSGYGHGLGVVYGVWLGVVLLLFPFCRWFARIKERHRAGWLSYL